MADYKVKPYTSDTLDHKTRLPNKKPDMRIKFYQPLRPIKDIQPAKTYDTKPPKNTKVRTYEAKTYDSCEEYVPPWSRGKEKGKKKQPPPPKTRPTEKKEKDGVGDGDSEAPKAKVTFAHLPPIDEKVSPSPALGSIKRMMDLFFI